MAILNFKSSSPSSVLRRGYTLDDLENNEQFQEISERFLTSVGEQSDDIFEYLRDSDFNLYNGMQRAMESGNFNEQQKQDYKYLRSTFDKADMGSLRQYAELIKDSTIDIATDPTLLAAMLLTPVSGGTSLVARQALATGANQGLKNIAKSKITPLQSTGLFALEGATWQGLDNHFRQQTEVNTNLRKLYSNPELVSSAAIGALTGGIFGGLANKNKFFEERLQKLYSDDGYRKEAGSDLVYNLRKKKDAFIAKTVGSPAWRLKTDAEFSPTARLLGQKLTSEFNKSLVNRSKTRLGYSYGEDLAFRRGNYKIGYEAAIEPLYATGRMSPELGEEVLTILRGGQVPGASKAVRDTAKNLRLYFDSIREDAIEVGINVSEIKNYFPRSWNREAIEANPDVFKKLLVDNNIIPEKEVDDVVKGMLNKQNELYSSHSNLLTQARKFENLDDNQFKEFLTNDLHSVTTDYFMNAARTIEHKKHFLSKGSDVKVGGKTEAGNLLFFKQSNEQQFVERFINPIQQELEEFGRTLSTKQQRELIDVYKSITGQVDYYRSDTFQAIYDGTKLANAMAYLPLATVSSLSEAFITLGKAPTSSAIKGMQDAIENSGRIFTTEIGQILKEKHKLTDNEITKEMNSVFLAVDEAMADLTNRLDGEGLQNETLKRGARGFYRLNLLIPWTKTVQLAAFSTGKDLIQSNLKQLSNPTGLSKNKIARLRGELNDLGVDIKKGLAWNNKFGDNVNIAAKEDNFYKNDIIRGAGRFTNGVILQTGREFANVPLFMTNPKLDIFTQFLRYPTVFGNTVLRNFAKETITDTTVNAPKLAAFVALSINVARATNYWRANEDERKRIEEESDWRDTLKALQRVGLLGPTEYLLRGLEGMAYGQNPLVAGVGTGGPILNDVIGMTLYDRGVLETVARKLPLRGTKNVFDRVVGDIMEEYTGIREPYTPLEKQAKELDKKLGGGFQSTADFVAGIEETDKLFKEIDLDRKLFNIGGRVGRGLQSKLKTIYSKVEDDMGGGSKTEEIFMDSYGNYSPTLKTLSEDSPEDVTGTKLFKWLQQQRSARGIKQKELDYLEVEEFIKNYEDFNGKQVAQALSDSKLKIIPSIRYSQVQTDETLEFDKTIFNADEAINFLKESPEIGSEQNYIYNQHPDIYLPVGRNAEGYESNPFQMIKLRLTSDEELTEGFNIEDIGEAFAFGNTEIGYQLYFPGLEKSNWANFDEITEAINEFGAMPMNPTEAKIRMNDVLVQLGIMDKSFPHSQYDVPEAIHKGIIDENSPGGENYRNFVFTVQGPKTLELKMNRMKYMHFDDDKELKQFGHAVTKDRVLKQPIFRKKGEKYLPLGSFKTLNTLNVEELQSDYMSNLIDFGIDTPTNRKIAKEIEKESDKAIQILRDKRFELRKILGQLRKNRDLESSPNIMYGPGSYIDRSVPGEAIRVTNQNRTNLRDIEFDNFLNNEYTEEEIKLLNTFINDWNKTDKLNLNVFDDLNKQRDGNTSKINKELNQFIKDSRIELGEIKEIKVTDYDNFYKRFSDIEPPRNQYVKEEVDLNELKKLDTSFTDIRQELSINGKFVKIINEKSAVPKFYELRILESNIDKMINKINKLDIKYGDPENLVVDNPIQDDWYKRIIDRLLSQAIKENMDALSIVQSDIINQRYSGDGKAIKDNLYNIKYKKYLEKLAKKYNSKFEVLEIDPKNLGDEPFEYFDSYSMEAIDDISPYNKDELFKVNTLIITDEMKKEILKRGDKSFSTGGLVTGPKVPDTKENPADRKDPNTGLPYSDQVVRLGLAEGAYLKPYQKEVDIRGERNFIMTEKLFHGSQNKEFKRKKIDKVLIPEYVRLKKQFPEISKNISYGEATKNLKEILLNKTKDFESTNRNLARGTNLSKSSASGFYQYIEGSVVPAYNRMERYYGKQNAQNIFGKALINNDSSVLTEEEQDILFIADMLQRKGTDNLIAPILFNRDNQSAKKLVLKEHHTLRTKNKDLYNKTIRRADLIWGK
tara:strand:+ start:4730 stop:10717 length:5988 start_codon:yes stop_codon:yes gene_type:complete